jgi:hypothetical protein
MERSVRQGQPEVTEKACSDVLKRHQPHKKEVPDGLLNCFPSGTLFYVVLPLTLYAWGIYHLVTRSSHFSMANMAPIEMTHTAKNTAHAIQMGHLL